MGKMTQKKDNGDYTQNIKRNEDEKNEFRKKGIMK